MASPKKNVFRQQGGRQEEKKSICYLRLSELISRQLIRLTRFHAQHIISAMENSKNKYSSIFGGPSLSLSLWLRDDTATFNVALLSISIHSPPPLLEWPLV